jgi:Ca2+-binding EF-hand superfamily protein
MSDFKAPVIQGTLTKRGGKDLYGKNTWRLRHFQLHLSNESCTTTNNVNNSKSVLKYYASEPKDFGYNTQPKGSFSITSKSTVITLEDEKSLEEHGLGQKYVGKKLFAFYSKTDVNVKEINSGVSNSVVVCECETQQVLQEWVTALSDAIQRERTRKANKTNNNGSINNTNESDQSDDDEITNHKNSNKRSRELNSLQRHQKKHAKRTFFKGALERAGLTGPLGGVGVPTHLEAVWEQIAFVDCMADDAFGFDERLMRIRDEKLPIRETLETMSDSCSTISRALGSLHFPLTVPETNAIMEVRRSLDDLTLLCRQIPAGTKDNNAFTAFLSVFIDRVRSMRPGALLMFPGGWSTQNDGNSRALIFTLQRLQGSFVFSVTNTGDGLEYHPIKADPSSDGFLYGLTTQFTEVPMDVCLDSSTWALLLRPLVHPQKTAEIAKDHIYARILPMLNNRPLMASVGAQPLRTIQFAPKPTGGDLSFSLCALEAARCALCSLGCPPKRANALVEVGVRHVMLEEALRNVSEISLLNTSACVALETACKTLAKFATPYAEKLAKIEKEGTDQANLIAGPVHPDMLAMILKCVEATRLRATNARRPTLLPPPLASPIAPRDSSNMQLFGKIMLEGGTDLLAGNAKPPPIIRPVELSIVPDVVSSVEEAAIAMRKAAHCCSILANQADLTTNSYAHRVALLVHLFVHVLPCPMPLTHEKRETHCFWRSARPKYETQLEISRSLNLCLRHFATASMSVSATRSFDANRLLTLSCMAAITDATLRMIPCDFPSVFSEHYDGTNEGPTQMFGFDTGPFAVEAEYLRFHCPERMTKLTKVLDYFHSISESIEPSHTLFRWEDDQQGMTFGPGEARLLDQVALSVGYDRAPDSLASYFSCENRDIADHYPELVALRDSVFMFKSLMAPTSDSLPDLRRWTFRDSQLVWKIERDDKTGAYMLNVNAFDREMKVAPWAQELRMVSDLDVDPKTGKKKKLYGFRSVFGGGFLAKSVGDKRPRCPPSGGNPSNLCGTRIDSEEDVLHLKVLPTFDDLLKPSETELLLTYLTAPMVRIPLSLRLFADATRCRALSSHEIQQVLDAVLFEPGPWQPPGLVYVPQEIPATTRRHMATPCGVLFHELSHAPAPLIDAAEELLALSLELDTGRHDAPAVPGVLFAARALTRMLAFITTLLEQEDIEDPKLKTRGVDPPQKAKKSLEVAQERVKKVISARVRPVIRRWLNRAAKCGAVRAACALHAHLAYTYYWTKLEDYDIDAAMTLFTAQSYIFVNHTFTDTPDGSESTDRKLAKDTGEYSMELGFPPNEIFDLFQRQRKNMLAWAKDNEFLANDVMNGIVVALTTRESSSSVPSQQEIVDASSHDRKWRLSGEGRFVAYPKDETSEEATRKAENTKQVLHEKFKQHYGEWLLATTTQNAEMEVNCQLGEFTVRRNRLRPLENSIRELPDFVAALDSVLRERNEEFKHKLLNDHDDKDEDDSFKRLLAVSTQKSIIATVSNNINKDVDGNNQQSSDYDASDEVVHCAEVRNTEHRKWLRLVGLRHDVEIWDPDPRVPTHNFTRPYASSDSAGAKVMNVLSVVGIGSGSGLTEKERWIMERLDPIIHGPAAAFLKGVELFLPTETFKGPVATLRGVGAPDVVAPEVQKSSWWWGKATKVPKTSAVDEENANKLLTEVVVTRDPPLVQVFRVESFGRRWRRALVFASNASWCLADVDPDGEPSLKDPNERFLLSAVRLGSRVQSLVVTRHISSKLGRQAFVPERHLRGIIPQALLQDYSFWRSEVTGDLYGSARPNAKHPRTMIYVQIEGAKGSAPIPTTANTSSLDSVFSGSVSSSKSGLFVDDARGIVHRVPMPTKDPSDFDFDPQNMPEGTLILVDLLYAAAGHTSSVEEMEGEIDEMSNLLSPRAESDETKNNPLKALARSIAAVEGLAHALVWVDKNCSGTKADANFVPVQRVELPRLGISFHAVKDTTSSSQTRLECEEHAGLFLASARTPMLDRLLSGLPHAMLLEARDGQLAVLLPAGAAPRRAAIDAVAKLGATKGLGADVIVDRWDVAWRDAVGDSKHYVYTVHASHAHLVCDSLASALYLCTMRFLARRYDDVKKLVDLLLSENDPTSEEAQLWDALGLAAIEDPNPDACAARIKILRAAKGTAAMDRLAGLGFNESVECLKYVQNWRAISANVRLTAGEELDVVDQTTASARVTEAERASFRTRKKNKDEKSLEELIAADPILLNRASYLRLLVHNERKLSMNVIDEQSNSLGQSQGFPLFYPQIPEQSEFDSIEDFSAFDEAITGDGPLGKLAGWTSSYSRPDDVSVNGSNGLNAVNKWIDSGSLALQKEHGFPLLFELLTGTVQLRVLPGDDPHRWGRALLRFVPRQQSEKAGTLMSILRVLAANSDIARECPRAEERTLGVKLSAMFTQDGAVGQLLKRVKPYLKENRERLPSQMKFIGERFTSPPACEMAIDTWYQTLLNGSRWALPRFASATLRQRKYPLENDPAVLQKYGANNLANVDLNYLSSQPLAVIDLASIIVSCDDDHAGDAVQSCLENGTGGLPFDVSRHPSAATPIAKQTLTRLRQDLKSSAERIARRKQDLNDTSKELTLKGFTTFDCKQIAIEAAASKAGQASINARAVLRSILEKLAKQVAFDRAAASEAAMVATATANGLDRSATVRFEMLRLGIQRRSGAWAEATYDDLLEAMACEHGEKNLLKITPGVSSEKVKQALHLTAQALLLTARAAQGAKCAAAAADTLLALSKCAKTVELDGQESLALDLGLRARGLAKMLCEKRSYFKKSATKANEKSSHVNDIDPFADAPVSAAPTYLTYDPRLLMFEFSLAIILRQRQVQLTKQFVTSAERGGGECAQMLMGEGKTTVVCPLLGYLLATDSRMVCQVVPHALLEFSRGTLRKSYSGVIRRSVVTLKFDRYTTLSDGKLLNAMRKARDERAVVITSPTALKSLALKFLEALHLLDQSHVAFEESRMNSNILKQSKDIVTKMFGVRRGKSRSERVADAGALSEEEVESLRKEAFCAAEIFQIFHYGVLILDEVDLILHPLKSELHWPLGQRIPLDFCQSRNGDGLRWKLPFFLLDAVFSLSNDRNGFNGSTKEAQGSQEASEILKLIHSRIKDAIQDKSVQAVPHVCVLDRKWYHQSLRPLLARWISVWLRAHGALRNMDDETSLAFLLRGDKAASTQLHREAEDEGVKMANLARDWLNALLPHVLSKINRVTFGLLTLHDVKNLEEWTQSSVPLSRRLLAVPFVGKDIPSRTNEFSHPDVVIGLTIAAYRIEGLRRSDFKIVLKSMLEQFSNEAGSQQKRPSSHKWAYWVRLAGKSVRGEARAKAQLEARRKSAHQGKYSNLTVGKVSGFDALLADISNVELNQHGSDLLSSSWLSDENETWPLNLVDIRDHEQVEELYQLLYLVPEVIETYLDTFVFPETAKHQGMKLSATGQELGGDVLFPVRLGFSGTPADLLPSELGAPKFELGTDAKVLATLSDRTVVTCQDMSSDWTVDNILISIATADPPMHALIDAGALITGKSNRAVAKFLLENGLPWAEGCVFLDENDAQMILMRRGPWEVIPLARVAAMPYSKRFSFYDQVHTTGMDIKQAAASRAALTLGKDMTLRDYAQGAWRMRGLGNGQSLELIITPEVSKLVASEVSIGEGRLPQTRIAELQAMSDEEAEKMRLRDVLAWLTINTMRAENVQAGLLAEQRAANVWRKHAYRILLERNVTIGTRNCLDETQKCLDVFRERVTFIVQNAIPEKLSASRRLSHLCRQYEHIIMNNEKAKDHLRNIVSDVTRMEAATLEAKQFVASAQIANASEEAGDDGFDGANVDKALQSEQVQENEQEQETEQEQEQEKEEEKMEEIIEEAAAVVKYSRDDEMQVSWKLDDLAEPQRLPFYKMQSFKVHQPGLKLKHTDPLPFPDYCWLSKNYFKPGWALNAHRRLKNSIIVMDLIPNLEELVSDLTQTITSSSSSQSNRLSIAQEDALRAAFSMFDSGGSGALNERELKDVLRAIDAVVDDDEVRLAELAKEVAQDAAKLGLPSAGLGVTFEELKRVIRQKNIYALQNGRYYVGVSLAEAESIRVAMHFSDADGRSNGDLVQFKNVEVALRIAGGTLLEGSRKYIPAGVFQGATAEQCFRFLDSQLDFEEREVSLLLRALQDAPCDKRASFFDAVRNCRRRPKIPWQETPLAKALTTADEFHLLASRALTARVRAQLKRKRMRLLDCFRAFDVERAGSLSYESLYGGLSWLGVDLSPTQMLDLAKRVNASGTGIVSREEFEVAFGPDDDWQKEWEEEDRVNVNIGKNNGVSNMDNNNVMDSFYGNNDIYLSNRDPIPAVSMNMNNSIDTLLGGAGPPIPRYDQVHAAPISPAQKKVHTTANVLIDDGTGLGDWASMGMAATLPEISKPIPAISSTKLSGHVPSRDDPFGLGKKTTVNGSGAQPPPAKARQPEMLAFEDWLSGDVQQPPATTVSPNNRNSDLMGNNMRSNKFASGAAAIEDARANISAKSLHKESDREKLRKDAAADAKLTRDVVRNFSVSLVHHKNFTRNWSSEGTGSRKYGTTWFPTGVVVAFAASSDVSKLSKKERINVGYFASDSRGGPGSDGAFSFEVNDGSAFALTGSQNMPRMIERLFPLPVRFRQIFAQQWKASSLFAWLPIAPPGHIALGMVFTTSPDAPSISDTNVRCVPEIWCERPSISPKLAWSNEGSGGAPCSIWRVNSLGMCFAKVGFDAPRADELWDIKRGNLIPAEALNSIRVDVNANSNLHNYKVSYGGSGISSDSPPPRNSASAYRPSSSGYGASSLI